MRPLPPLKFTERAKDNFYPKGSDLSSGEIKRFFKTHFDIVNLQYPTESIITDIEIIGSRAWGNPINSSDLDILIRYEGREKPEELKSIFTMSSTRLELGDLEVDPTFTKMPIEKWIKNSFKKLNEDYNNRDL